MDSQKIADRLSALSVKEKLEIFEKSFEGKESSVTFKSNPFRNKSISTSDNNPSTGSANNTPLDYRDADVSKDNLKFVYDNEKILNESRTADPNQDEFSLITNIFQKLNNYIDVAPKQGSPKVVHSILKYSEKHSVPQTKEENEFYEVFDALQGVDDAYRQLQETGIETRKSFKTMLEKLELEAKKQEILLYKICRVIELLKNNHKNISDLVNGERHLLVSQTRLQECLIRIKEIKNKDKVRSRIEAFNHKGTMSFENIMLEVRSTYFEKAEQCQSDFLVCIIKYNENVVATKPMKIENDIKIVKFPDILMLHDVFLDFDIRMEIFGTYSKYKTRENLRKTTLRKLGTLTITVDEIHDNKFKMTELVSTRRSPIRKKILMNLRNSIIADVQFESIIFVFYHKFWHKSLCSLNGHLLKVYLGCTNKKNGDDNYLLFDLHNLEKEIIPVSEELSDRDHSFLLKFNHYVENQDFYLMAATSSANELFCWAENIKKALVLLK